MSKGKRKMFACVASYVHVFEISLGSAAKGMQTLTQKTARVRVLGVSALQGKRGGEAVCCSMSMCD